jgi:hypothetical protein
LKRGAVVVAMLDPGDWSASFGLSLVDLLLADATIGNRRIVGHLRKFCSTGGLVDARNALAAEFLDSTEAEWLFLVDTDMGFAPDTVERLIASADLYKRPVVGALCFAGKRRARAEHHVTRFYVCPTVYSFVDNDDEIGFLPMLDYPRKQLIEVAGTGAACMIVHRRALQKVREKRGDTWFDLITLRGTTFSEDLSFCMRLASVDVPVFVDTAVTTSHYKVGVYLDEYAFDTQPPIAAEPA